MSNAKKLSEDMEQIYKRMTEAQDKIDRLRDHQDKLWETYTKKEEELEKLEE